VRVVPADPGSHLTAYCDGAARGNPGPAGIGAVVLDADGGVLAEVAEGIGIATNNVAEYRAAIAALRSSAELGARRVTLRADSKLLVEQLAGRWRVKNPTLIRLHGEARALLAGFERVELEHVRREFNKLADRLANRGVDAWLAEHGGGARSVEPPPFLFDPPDGRPGAAGRLDAEEEAAGRPRSPGGGEPRVRRD
jgi:ribonuclease H / adenosylcobalamin/alpha-ribazole phosphatase